MGALIINLFNVILLSFVIKYCIKRRIDSSILYYCLITLFFINIPLLFDAIMTLYNGINQWERVLADANKVWTFGTLKHIDKVSADSLLFNICFLLSYWLICKRRISQQAFCYRPLNSSSLASLSWVNCFLLVFLGFIVFVTYNGIASFYKMDVGEWYIHRTENRFLALLSSFLVPMMSVGVIRVLFSRDFIRGTILLLPIIVIGYFTGARSQIISVVFYFLFYFFWANERISFNKIILFLVFTVTVTFILIKIREDVSAVYPIYKDWSYCDLFYVYDVGKSISTHGLNSLSMILRDFAPQKVDDITILVADSKFGIGWGSLHPTLLGWAYVDLLNYFWLIAVFFGILLAFFDRIRHRMSAFIYFSFLSYEFSFLAIAIRGSVQYAYSQLLYPTLLLIVLFSLDKMGILSCHAHIDDQAD